MSNIKVLFRKALEPSRAERTFSEVMTVASIKFRNGQYEYQLAGNKKTLTRRTSDRYSVGDRLIVSEGDIVGKDKKNEVTFLV